MAKNLEQKYTEAEYFFQTIEMASDEPAQNTQNELDYFSWKVVKRRQKPQRRYTVSHGAPPAPPSTPTSLSKEHEPLLSPTSFTDSSNGNNAAADDSDSERFQLLYTLDYAPKFKKKLKEQERTAAELAELFKVVTITGGTSHEPTTKTAPEHGVSFASRRIRRELNVGSFKVHRNPTEEQRIRRELDDEVPQQLWDEDSLSAPEFERSEVAQRRCLRRFKKNYRCTKARRKMLVKDFELMDHMDEIADSFDAAVSFRPAQ